MKLKSYKPLIIGLCLSISTGVFAQKTSKKFTERFNINKDVEIEINASHTEIDVTTWDKNEVSVEAFVEIEGLSKKEAEKYFEKYNFEALGNKSKVKISSRSANNFSFKNDFVIFNNDNFTFPEIVIPEMPEIPEFPNIDAIVIPEIDFENIFMNIDDIDFDFDEYSKDGKSYFFKWKDGMKDVKIKSKKDWEKFKKSKDYKKLKEEMKKAQTKVKKEMARVKVELSKERKEEIKEALEKAKVTVKNIDMSKISKELAKVKKQFNNKKFSYILNSDSDEIMVDGKKVKIKKRLVIKVPKKASFDLNTRHCKIKLPKSKTSGKVSYGSFNSTGLEGGSLKISSSPVKVSSVNESILSLNNVTDALLTSVTNSQVSSVSGTLKISELGNNVTLDADYGEVEINKVNPEIQAFIMNLRQSDAILNFLNLDDKIVIRTKDNRSKIMSDSKKNSTKILGSFTASTKNNKIRIVGRYSELLIKK